MAAGQRAPRRRPPPPGIGLSQVTTEGSPAHVKTPWSQEDELNWAADRAVLRDLKKRGEEPSEWLAAEHAELDARRKAVAKRQAR